MVSSNTSDIVLIHDQYWVVRVASGKLRPDTAQGRVAQRLQRLQVALSSQYTTNAPILGAYRDYLRQCHNVNAARNKDRKRQPTQTTSTLVPPNSPTFQDSSKQQSSLTMGNTIETAPSDTATAHSLVKPATLPLQSHQPVEPFSTGTTIPRGLYLYGSVGTGKSMLMDAFYEHTVGPTKRRYHFHEFMSHIHVRLHQLRTKPTPTVATTVDANNSIDGPRFENSDDDEQAFISSLNPVVQVALDMASEFTLLCLDEFQVVDIADAVILALVFTTLFRAGTILVTTSNRPVTQLYDDPTMSAIPFIQLLQTHCIVHEIKSTVDYRQLLSSVSSSTGGTAIRNEALPENPDLVHCFDVVDKGSYWVRPFLNVDPSTQESPIVSEIINFFNDLGLSFESSRKETVDLDVGFQRSIQVQQVACNESLIACCTFDELCSSRSSQHYYGPGEYRAIARHFDAIIIQNIPVLSNGNAATTHSHSNPTMATLQQEHWRDHNEARRFITLVDELYEARTMILCSAAVPLSQLFRLVSEAVHHEVETTAPGRVNDDDSAIDPIIQTDPAHLTGAGALVSVKELPFAFRRAASRITELTSSSRWKSLQSATPLP